MTNQMQDKTTKDNHQNAALISHDFSETSCVFLLQEIFNFTFLKYWNFSFAISALVEWNNINECIF